MILWNRHSKLNRDIRSFRRFWEIVETVAAYGFSSMIGHDRRARSRRSGTSRRLNNKGNPEKLRMLLEELGPTFVKFGQILSTRPDMIGEAYAAELANLAESVSPFEYRKVKDIIRRELGQVPEKLFLSFEHEPLAAASIGQVHLAKLHDGSEVVVKVQRPGIIDKIELDLAIMTYLAGKVEAMNSRLAEFQPVRVVGEFARGLRRELDYSAEAANMLRFARGAEGVAGLKVPAVHLELSSERVLTMERIVGDSAARVVADEDLRAKYDLKTIAGRGVNSLLHQIFKEGFFHADPHPGNIFLLAPDGLCFIDFGMMGRINEVERHNFQKVLDCALRGEISAMTDYALRMTITGELRGSRDELERDLADLVDSNINLPLEKLSIAGILGSMLEVLPKYHLALKPDLYMMFKSLITIEQLGRNFDPQMKITELVKPFLLQQKIRSFDPVMFLRRMFDEMPDNIRNLNELPRMIFNIISKTENGDLSFRVEHHRLDDIEETLYITGERLSRSLLLTAAVVGSALVIVAKTPPLIGGVPVIGVAGFCLFSVLSVLIMWQDHRQRKHFLRERLKRKQEQRLSRRNRDY